MKKAVEILERLRELLSDPNRWCQGSSALNKDGKSCWGASSEACKWCLMGGLSKVSVMSNGLTTEARVVACQALEGIVSTGLAKFNDSHSHQEVLELIDRGIELERSKGRSE